MATKKEMKTAFEQVFINHGFNLGGNVGNKLNAGKAYKRPYKKTKAKGE